MFALKYSLALFAIAAGGFLTAGSEPPNAMPISPTPRVLQDSAIPTDAHMQRDAEQSLLAQVRADLRDDEATIRLSALRFQRTSNRSLEGKGHGFILFAGTDAIPIEVAVTYDLPTSRIEQANYLISAMAKPSKPQLLGKQMVRDISDRIGARLVLEFSQQPVDFSLLEISHFSSGRDRIMISGTGITEFAGEGAAHTRFVATADKSSGHILSISYELLQEVAADGAQVSMLN